MRGAVRKTVHFKLFSHAMGTKQELGVAEHELLLSVMVMTGVGHQPLPSSLERSIAKAAPPPHLITHTPKNTLDKAF